MNINKVNVLIITIFVVMFILYMLMEKRLHRNQENFKANKGSNIDKDIKDLVKNIIKFNITDKDICTEQKKVNDAFVVNNFIFLNIIKNTDVKKYLSIIQSNYEKITKVLNRCINICNKYKDNEFFNKIKLVFTNKKNISLLYKTYFDSNYRINNDVGHKQNTLILQAKMEVGKRLLKEHDNLNSQIVELMGLSSNFNVNDETKEMYEFFLDSEKIKNEQYQTLLDNSGIFTFLNNLRNVEINSENFKVYKKLIDTKNNLLLNISKISGNQNGQLENFSLTKKTENGKSEEIVYLETSNDNTNTLINFCRKMRKLDSPSEGGLMFKRFNKEFKKKKEIQIEKLQNEIDKIIDSMTQQEKDDFNLYMARTHDQASKQMEAINLAKDNLENAKKLKVNLS